MSLMIKKLAGASQTQSLASYAVLLKQVRQAISHGKERALDAVEREAVRTKWETGKLIHEHILLNQDRAAYGQQVLKKLSRDLAISETELGYMVEFARAPISPALGKLSWYHNRELLSVNDPEKRETLARKAVKQKWTGRQVSREAKKLKGKTMSSPSPDGGIPLRGNALVGDPKLPEIQPGKPGVYMIYRLAAGELAVDLGFSNHYRPAGPFRFNEGDIVFSNGSSLKLSNDHSEALFTYTAKVLEVIDGDTLKAQVDLGFGFSTNQKLRLRGLDAPEIISRGGLKAKAFVQKMIGGKTILIKTTKSDKYDRYLVDVWVAPLSSSKSLIGDPNLIHLNQALLTKGLAKRAEE